MGVSTLVGIADGTGVAAAMYDNTTGWMIGPIWEADDAYEQIDAFQKWMQERKYMAVADEIGLVPENIPDPTHDNPSDVRAWPDNGLEKLIAYWQREYLDDAGNLKQEVTADA